MKITKDFVLFWDGIPSNWHPARITDPITGKVFANTEQAFMWYKADFHKDTFKRDIIEQTENPAHVKKLGREIANYNDAAWSCVRFGFMKYVNMLKFTQIEEYKQFLIDTKDRIIVEASPYDKIWGIGLGVDDPDAMDLDKWQGLNLLGVAIMEVRHLIVRGESVS